MFIPMFKTQVNHLKFMFRLLEKSKDVESKDVWEVKFEKALYWKDILVSQYDEKCATRFIDNAFTKDEVDQHDIQDFFFFRVNQANENLYCDYNRNQRDDPCDEVNIYVRISESNRSKFHHFKAGTLKFHYSNHVLEIVRDRSSIESIGVFESFESEHHPSILFTRELGCLHKFSATILGFTESSDLDLVEELILEKRNLAFNAQINRRHNRLLMFLHKMKYKQKMNDHDNEIVLEIISAEGYYYDNIRISYYILSHGWKVTPNCSDSIEDSIENVSKYFGFTHISRCCFKQHLTVNVSLIVLVVSCCGVYIFVVGLSIMRLIILSSIFMATCHEFFRGSSTFYDHLNGRTFASFFHSVSLAQSVSESDPYPLHSPEILFVVSTCSGNTNSIVGFAILHPSQIFHECEIKLRSTMISSAPGIPEWWIILQDFFLGSPITVQDIADFLAEGSNHFSTRPSGSVKIRLKKV